ncbi:MAG: tyrosine-type recombinase/integrase [Lachnospiraceae bacterium]|nr:tyrosine-type recombinase/integrase [Lachnospiraceae bacterium]
MNTAQPIRKPEDLRKIKSYYEVVNPNTRNQLLIIMGLNTALRISDILSLKWDDVYDFDKDNFKTHIILVEQKTGKISTIYINNNVIIALKKYQKELEYKQNVIEREWYLFRHKNENIAISRVQAFRIIKNAAEYNHIQGVICCHSLRKTFGYYAWKQGVSPALLMNIYNHSSFQNTKRYLGIEQDDRDKIFELINL